LIFRLWYVIKGYDSSKIGGIFSMYLSMDKLAETELIYQLHLVIQSDDTTEFRACLKLNNG
jgi:hypothetical protein